MSLESKYRQPLSTDLLSKEFLSMTILSFSKECLHTTISKMLFFPKTVGYNLSGIWLLFLAYWVSLQSRYGQLILRCRLHVTWLIFRWVSPPKYIHDKLSFGKRSRRFHRLQFACDWCKCFFIGFGWSMALSLMLLFSIKLIIMMYMKENSSVKKGQSLDVMGTRG